MNAQNEKLATMEEVPCLRKGKVLFFSNVFLYRADRNNFRCRHRNCRGRANADGTILIAHTGHDEEEGRTAIETLSLVDRIKRRAESTSENLKAIVEAEANFDPSGALISYK